MMEKRLMDINVEFANREENRCQQILRDRREALAEKMKKN